jgi:hypothetical protein
MQAGISGVADDTATAARSTASKTIPEAESRRRLKPAAQTE